MNPTMCFTRDNSIQVLAREDSLAYCIYLSSPLIFLSFKSQVYQQQLSLLLALQVPGLHQL
jgi:hypothetical protein